MKGVTVSKWCHCGVVDHKDGRWGVCLAELDGWVLEKGETITLSSKGYADKRIVVP